MSECGCQLLVVVMATAGDRFREVFGEKAGWAQAVSLDPAPHLKQLPAVCSGVVHS